MMTPSLFGRSGRGLRLLAMMALLLAAVSAHAQVPGFEKLVMPGRVIQGHADIEGDCGACHDTQSDMPQAALCMDCHEDIAADRDEQRGFHGLFAAAKERECVVCHTDHEGRSADIVPVNGGIFDHDFSDFPLLGAHLSASCTDCHAPGDKHRAAPASCLGCHAGDDAHEGELGSLCQDCHNEVAWTETNFDHDTVGYRLTGQHADVQCVDCHRGNVFDGAPRSCVGCHAIDDVHGGSNGTACQDCHTTSTWQSIGFDHLQETGFALADGHGGLNCQDCHTREDFKDGLESACVGCHLTEDDHGGVNGTECESCHVAAGWDDSTFDHSTTNFALHESHAELHCAACHKDSTSNALPLDCGSCHSLDDSHGGQLGEDCAACHGQTEWHTNILFDHDLSTFPLTGMHAAAACGSCHLSNQFKDADEDCVGCHAEDDVHGGSLGADCAACHTSNEWSVALFDHGVQTGFELDGGHADVACSGCHRDEGTDLGNVPSTCGGCHQSDDVHAGQFGARCDSCHNATDFAEVDGF